MVILAELLATELLEELVELGDDQVLLLAQHRATAVLSEGRREALAARLGAERKHLGASSVRLGGQVEEGRRVVVPGGELGLHLLDGHGGAVLEKL